MDDLINEAIDFIRKHEPPEGYFVGFSGGKDSIVTLDLVRKSGVKHRAFFNVTTIDPPEVLRFIRENYASVIWIKPEMTFWQWIDKKGLPLRHRRWCCEKLKHGVRANRSYPEYKTFCAGIRAEESPIRKARGRISINPHTHVTTYKPIFEWSSPEVWDYINSNGLSYPRLYDEGFARIGCIICPFLSKKLAKQSRDRWPGMYRVFDKKINQLWKTREAYWINLGFTYEEFMSWPNWKTKEQRRQLNIEYAKGENQMTLEEKIRRVI